MPSSVHLLVIRILCQNPKYPRISVDIAMGNPPGSEGIKYKTQACILSRVSYINKLAIKIIHCFIMKSSFRKKFLELCHDNYIFQIVIIHIYCGITLQNIK